jgi:hypothetical protein
MKKHVLSLLLVAGMLPLTAFADCMKFGHIIQVKAIDDMLGGDHKITLRTNATAASIWTVTTHDDDMAAIATTALTSVSRVRVYGDAIACPGGGGFMGKLKRIDINP